MPFFVVKCGVCGHYSRKNVGQSESLYELISFVGITTLAFLRPCCTGPSRGLPLLRLRNLTL